MPDQKKYTIQEFGQYIKTKYPEYNSQDDSLLATKIIEKYPQYKAWIAEQPTQNGIPVVNQTTIDSIPENQKATLPREKKLSFFSGETPEHYITTQKNAAIKNDPSVANEKLNRASAYLGELNKYKNELELSKLKYVAEEQKKTGKVWGGIDASQGLNARTIQGTNPNPEAVQPRQLNGIEESTLFLIDKSNELKNVYEKTKEGSIAGNLGYGVGKGLQGYAQGYFKLIDEIKSNNEVRKLTQKIDQINKGADLDFTKDEAALLKALQVNDELLSVTNQLLPTSYQIGSATGQSLGFMGEFMLTGGVGSEIAGSVKALGAGSKAVGRMSANLASKLIQSGIQVGTMPGTYANAARNISTTGEVGKSLYDAYYDQFTESLTERLFVGKIGSAESKNAILRLIGRTGNAAAGAKGWKGVVKGMGEEYIEEKMGEIMNIAHDNETFGDFWKEFTNGKNNLTTLGSTALITGVLGFGGMGVSKIESNRFNSKLNDTRKTIPPDIADKIDEAFSGDITVKQAEEYLANIINSSELTDKQKKDIAPSAIYYTTLKIQDKQLQSDSDKIQTVYRGLGDKAMWSQTQLQQEKRRKSGKVHISEDLDGNIIEVVGKTTDGKIVGYTATGEKVITPADKIKDPYEISTEEFNQILDSKAINDEERKATEKNEFEIQEIQKIDKHLSEVTHENGEVIKVIANGKEYYLKSGDIDNAQSGDMLIGVNAETKQPTPIDISQISNTERMLASDMRTQMIFDALGSIEVADQQIRENPAEQVKGKEVIINGKKGVITDVTDAENNVGVQYEDGTSEFITPDQYQNISTVAEKATTQQEERVLTLDEKTQLKAVKNPDGTFTVGDVINDEKQANKLVKQLNSRFAKSEFMLVNDAETSNDPFAVNQYRIISKPKNAVQKTKQAEQEGVTQEVQQSQEVRQEGSEEGGVESKKADIERRRQENLKSEEYRTTVSSELWTDEDGNFYKVEKQADGKNKISASDENGRTLAVLGSWDSSVELNKLIGGGLEISKVKDLEFTNKIVDKINAKYDAELASLESNQSQIYPKLVTEDYTQSGINQTETAEIIPEGIQESLSQKDFRTGQLLSEKDVAERILAKETNVRSAEQLKKKLDSINQELEYRQSPEFKEMRNKRVELEKRGYRSAEEVMTDDQVNEAIEEGSEKRFVDNALKSLLQPFSVYDVSMFVPLNQVDEATQNIKDYLENGKELNPVNKELANYLEDSYKRRILLNHGVNVDALESDIKINNINEAYILTPELISDVIAEYAEDEFASIDDLRNILTSEELFKLENDVKRINEGTKDYQGQGETSLIDNGERSQERETEPIQTEEPNRAAQEVNQTTGNETLPQESISPTQETTVGEIPVEQPTQEVHPEESQVKDTKNLTNEPEFVGEAISTIPQKTPKNDTNRKKELKKEKKKNLATQKVIDGINDRIKEIDKKLKDLRSKRESKKRELEGRKTTQTDLFVGEAIQKDKLFDVKADYSRENIVKALQDFDGEIKKLQDERVKLFETKEQVVKEASGQKDLIPERPDTEGEMLDQWVLDYSTDPQEIYASWLSQKETAPLQKLSLIEEKVLGRRVNRQSFKDFSDKNNIDGGLALAWFTKKGEGTNSNDIDVIAQEISEETGKTVTPDEVVDIMLKFRTGEPRKTTDLQNDLAAKYKLITGQNINTVTNETLEFDESTPFKVKDITETKEFKEWSKNSPILETYEIQKTKPGETQVFKVYHGTTNEFYVFDPSIKGNKEGHYGMVNYFTSDKYDADNNYAGAGPDLTNRIEQKADQTEWEIEQEIEQDGFEEVKQRYDIPDDIDETDYHGIAKHIAIKELHGGEEKTMELFVRLDNPVVVGGVNETWISPYDEDTIKDYLDEATEQIKEENSLDDDQVEDYQDEIRDRAIELSGSENRIFEAAQRAAWDNGVDAQDVISALPEESYYEEISATKLDKALRKSESIAYLQGENGELISHQLISDIFKNLGYDGIVLVNARQHFQNMDMDPNASHIHVFEGNESKIKLADGSNTTFSQTNNDIRFKVKPLYSNTEKALQSIKQEKATPEQWKAMLLKNGSKEAELTWMGFDDFVKDKKSLTKNDLTEFVNSNKVDVQEVVKGSSKWEGNELIDNGDVVANLVHNDAENNISNDSELYKEYLKNLDVVQSLPLTDELAETALQGFPMFNRKNPTEPSILGEYFDYAEQKKEFNAEVAFIVNEYSQRLNIKINVLDNETQSPEPIQKTMHKKRYKKGSISGVFYPANGEIYLFKDNVKDLHEVKITILHEGVGHKGMKLMLGPDYYPILMDVYDSMRQEDIDRISELYGTKNPLIIADEYFGEWAEKDVKPNFIQRAISRIKALLRKLFNIKYSDKDIQDLLVRSKEYLENNRENIKGEEASFKVNPITKTKAFRDWFGDSKVVDENGEPLVVYHGTDMDFNEFSNKLKQRSAGTKGGFWFTDNSSLAESYTEFGNYNKEAYERALKYGDIYGNSIGNSSIMPVYLSIKNPLIIDAKGQKSGNINGKTISDLFNDAINNGNDGVIINNVEDSGNFKNIIGNVYGVFSPTQIKSATGNDGTFDPNNPDIRFKVKPEKAEGVPIIIQTAREVLDNEPSKKTWKEMFTNFREIIQDRDLPIRDIEKEIVKRGGKQDDSSKPYRDKNLSFGRIEAMWDDFRSDIMKPIYDVIAKYTKKGLSKNDIMIYMIAKHASERNQKIRLDKVEEYKLKHPKATPEEVIEYHNSLKNKDFSGVLALDPNKEFENRPEEFAEKLVEEYEKTIEKDEFWKVVNKATKYILDRQHKAKMFDDAQYQAYKEGYKYYVPLRGWWEAMEKQLDYHSSVGVGKSMKKAEGRVTLPDDPLVYIEQLAFRTIGEQVTNEVNESMLNLMLNNYKDNRDLFSVRKIYYIQDGTGEFIPTTEVPTKEMFQLGLARVEYSGEHEKFRKPQQADEHEVWVNTDNGPYAMVFQDLETAQAMNNQNNLVRVFWAEKALDAKYFNENFLVSPIHRVTGLMKALFTSWNPVFPVTNLMRDFNEAASYMFVTGNTKDSAKMVGNLFKDSFRTVGTYLYRKNKFDPKNNELHKYFQEFREDGGQTGFTHSRTTEQIEKDIKKEISKSGHKVDPRKIFDQIERFSQLFEDATRFAAYVTSRKAGLTRKESARVAKEASVNFNRSGKLSKTFDSFYAFFNVAIQSAQKNVKMAKDFPKRFLVATAGWATLGLLMAELNRFLDDDDEYEQLSDWVRQNYLVIPLGDKYLRVPLPQFFRAFYSVGTLVSDVSHGKKIGKAAGEAGVNLVASLSPIDPGGFRVNDEWSIGPLIPTFVKPIHEIAVNQNYLGARIYKETFTKELEKDLADSQLGKENVNPVIKFFTDGLFETAGGNIESGKKYYRDENGINKRVSEWADWNPSKIEHLLTTYTGGSGKLINDMVTTLNQAFVPNETVDSDNIPYINAFIRKYPEKKWGTMNNYYDMKEKVDEHIKIMKSYIENNPKKAEEMAKDKTIIAMSKVVKPIETQLKNLKERFDAEVMTKDEYFNTRFEVVSNGMESFDKIRTGLIRDYKEQLDAAKRSGNRALAKKIQNDIDILTY